MEVTRSNFEQVFPQVQEAINDATFLALDGEFTGIGPRHLQNVYDTPAEYYQKLSNDFMTYLLIQFGLAAFKYNPDTKKFTYKVYSFYVFPKTCTFGKGLYDCKFAAQSSAFEFLANNNFDFNKVFKDGIPYLNIEQQETAAATLEARRRLRLSNSSVVEGAADSLIMPLYMTDIVRNLTDQINNMLESDDIHNVTMKLHDQNTRQFAMQYLKLKFGFDKLLYSMRDWSVTVSKREGTLEDRLLIEKERSATEDEVLKETIGFFRVFDSIYRSRKPIVGHNMFLDMCHFIRRFWKPLPDEYFDFKNMVHHVFPTLFDTKHLATCPLFGDKLLKNGLNQIYQVIQEPPFSPPKFEADLGEGYNQSEWKLHDAGFDAYVTGVIFQTMANYIGAHEQPPIDPVLPHSHLLQNYTNKLFMIVPHVYANLDGPEVVIERNHVFFVIHPRTWKVGDIFRLFNSYGGVFTKRVSDAITMVTLHDKSQADKVKKVLIDDRRAQHEYLPIFRLLTYEEFGFSRPRGTRRFGTRFSRRPGGFARRGGYRQFK